MNGRTTPRLTLILLAILALATSVTAAIAQDFTDVPKWHWAWAYIQGARDAGVSAGYDDGTYQPSVVVDRDQMAVFIARAMSGGDANVPAGPDTATFADVPNTGYGSGGTDPYWAYKYIEYAVANHVVAGYDDGLYHPDWDVTRGQMAAFIARAICGGDDSVPDPSGDPRFPDVTDTVNSWCYKHVEYIAAKGVTLGYPDGSYHPEVACTRDQMAVYLCRAFSLPMPALPYNVTDYMPLSEGSSWVYESNDGVFTRTVSGVQSLWGQTYARMVSTRGKTQYWQAQPDGLRLGGMAPPDGGTTSYNPGLLIANGIDPTDEGSQTSPTFVDTTAAGDTAFSFEFVSVETVTVPAGTFENCMKLHLRQQTGTQEADEFNVWLAKGVGVVKKDWGEFGSDSWEVLISATVGDHTYPADKGPFRLADYRPLDVGSTLVYTGSDGDSIDQIVGVDRVGDVEAARVDRGPIQGPVARQYFAVIDGALSLVGEYMADSSTLLTFSPPVAFPTAPSIGDTGSSTVQVYDGDTSLGTATLQWAAVGAGPVTVAAGEFDNCLKLRVRLRDPSDETEEYYMWLAVGVGTVKEDTRPFGGTYWRELTSAKVLGVEYPTAGRTFDISDYIDLTLGNEWTYDMSGSSRTYSVTSIFNSGGHDWAYVETPTGSMYILRADESGLFHLSDSAGSSGASFVYDPPITIGNGLAPGDGSSQTFGCSLEGSYAGEGTFDYTFDGIEAVSTDAGLFPDAMKISYTLHLPTMATGAAESGTEWFARGIGLVKKERSSAEDVLTSAVIGGVHYPAGDTAFTVTDYLPVEIGNQWAYINQGESWFGASGVVIDGIQVVTGLPITDTVYKLSRYEGEGYAGSDLVAIRDDGIGIYGYVDPSSGAMVVNPPIIIPNGAKVGDFGSLSTTAYTWQTDHWVSGGALQAFWELAGAGSVTTSAGEFRDCILIHWGANSAATGDMVKYVWYARGVGVVKQYEVGQASWAEVMGATIGGTTIPETVAPSASVAAAIPQGSGVGFDFSSGSTVAQPEDQDLRYIYTSATDASLQSFDTAGISRFVGSGQNDFESLRAYSTFLPAEWDLWGRVWQPEAWVLGIGGNAVEDSAVVKTRDGQYALVHITAISASQIDMDYVYPYGFFGE